jgi:pilus assembly protein CpaB
MKRSGRVYIIAGVVLALVAGALLFLYLNQVTQQVSVQVTPTPRPPVDVVVVTKDLKAGTILAGDMLKREPFPADHPNAAADTVRDLSEAIDRVVIADVKSGTALKRGDLQALPFVLPKGKKAMALFVDDLSSVGGLVRERDYVDVVISGKIKLASPSDKAVPTPRPAAKPQAGEDEDQVAIVQPVNEQTVVKAVLQRIQVLKVIQPQNAQTAQQQQQQAQQQQAAGATPAPTPVAPPQGRISNAKAIVILAVTDQEAELLRFAGDTGGLQMILRGRDDTDHEETKGMTLDILIRDYGLPVPRPVVVDTRSQPQP